jgi:hypothetical protein
MAKVASSSSAHPILEEWKMKAVYKIAAGLAVAGLATAAIAARPMPHKVSPKADGSTSGIAAAAAGFNYSTDFEATGAAGGYNTTGYINNGAGLFPAGCGGVAAPCWGHTTGAGFSLITPTIDTNFPAGGTQHLRVTDDPTTRTNQPNFGLGVDARFPRTADLSARPIAPNTVSIDLSISNPNGQDFRVQPQSNSKGFLATSALFFYSGAIYILDDVCATVGLNFQPTGVFWDTTGAYQNYTVAMNPCANTTVYTYAGAPLYASCIPAGQNLEQFLIFGDNYPGSEARVDNMALASDENCPQTCGNGILEGTESCEPGNQPTGCNPGHTCGAAGSPGECTCDRICTLDAPCVLTNGANGPFMGPFDASFGGIFVYEAPDGVDAVSVELCGTTGIDSNILYFGSCSDPADPGSSNDDCDGSAAYGAGSDPSASCYHPTSIPSPFNSCTCHDNPLAGDNCYLLQTNGGNDLDAVWHIEINKKAACAQGHLGACCDTNGADAGCTDNVLEGACSGADKVWTENGKCADVTCECIPNCTGATCGDDGCGGSCGTCGDGDVCNGEETCDVNNCVAGTPLACNDGNACNGVESCNPSSGCVPGTPLACDNGVACDGVETCNASSGCVAGTAVNCDDGQDCSVDTCNEPDGTCSHDTSGCSIPTVSEWGLVVLTLMLLIGAKVYFGRRQAIA